MRVPATILTKSRYRPGLPVVRNARHAACLLSDSNAGKPSGDHGAKQSTSAGNDDQGAMSRRLSELSEESLTSGGSSARKAVEEAGFSDELRAKLQDKIAGANFRNDNASAFATADLPASAGRGTADIATARAWSGTESVEDAALRMLDDAHKPLRPSSRSPSKVPGIRGPPKSIDTGRSGNKATGKRLANARDKSSIYAFLKDDNLSQDEKEKFRKELKERFQPGARSIPATIQGLQSLANERIEDAIARGQFRNLPRGQKIERDYNASNPFLDTTEYFMNKMIQRQDIVPPWIEKQQELVATAARFRAQLRATWRRHVARTIASRGGSLQDQIKLADAYALAEHRQASPAASTSDGKSSGQEAEQASESQPTAISAGLDGDENQKLQQMQPEESITIGQPFRDPRWEATELSYHTLAVKNLNDITRSYNLMAPDLAKKPYFNLARELRSCFADVAGEVAGAIRERALAPRPKTKVLYGDQPSGVLGMFSTQSSARIYEETRPQYGLRELWRDLFKTDKDKTT